MTRCISLGATVSTSTSESPTTWHGLFATLHHISGGRAAWNIVTSSHSAASANFGKEGLHEHDLRYEIANEFVDAVKGLWETWDDGAIVANKATGVFLDKSKIHALNHKGRFYSVKGPLNIERCLQRHPRSSSEAEGLAARTGALCPNGRPRIFGGQRPSAFSQGRL